MYNLTEMIRTLIRSQNSAEESRSDEQGFEGGGDTEPVSEARECATSRDETVWRRAYSRF